MRLIDADSLLREVGNYSLEVACNKSDGRLETMTKVTQAVQDHAAECIDDAPTINPETFPIVRRLREELARVTAERDAAVECIYNIEDDLDRGNDNDWAREHISEWSGQQEDR